MRKATHEILFSKGLFPLSQYIVGDTILAWVDTRNSL